MMGPRSMGAGTQWDGGPRGEGPSRQRTYDEYPSDSRETKLALTPAQRLIERYERMSTPPLPPQTPPGSGAVGYTTGQMMRTKSTRSRQYVYDYRKEAAAAAFDDDGGAGNDKRGRGLGNLKKDRSPIRQSLKNLFSVLKKGAGGLAKRSHGLHHGKGEESLVVPGHGGVVSANNEVGSKTNDHERCDAQNLNNAAPVSVPPLHHLNRPPRKKMTGPLLYLSRQSPLCNADADSSSEDIPNIPAPRAASGPNALHSQTESESSSWAWSTCSVTLEEGKLVVSCFTGDLELYVHEIALVRCVDIRSLSTAQLEAGVKEEGMVVVDLSEDKEREMKVFEMTFADGRGKERFAAKSVRERAGWISAIWDAILPSQDIHEKPEPTPEEGKDRSLGPSKQDNVDSRKLPVESPTPTPLPKMSSLLSHSQHSPPPPPPLPSKSHNNTTTGVASLNLPTIAPLVPHKKPPDLHLDLSEFAGPISPPSIYPPTVTPGASQNEVVISPSIYGQAQQERLGQPQPPPSSSASSRPASIFVASPVSLVSPGSGSAPNSPSIRNLSQLSVVRQRLAQIQRNHSEISGESRYSYSAASHSPAVVAGSPTSAHLRARARGVGGGGTPLASPISPAGSGWSKSEAVFYRKGKACSRDDDAHRSSMASPRSDCTITDEQRKEGQEIDRRKVSNNKTRPRANSHRDHGHGPAVAPPISISPGKTTTAPSKDDIRRLAREVNGIKNVLGGESGCSTVHEMVFSLEQRMRGEKKDLRAIKDELKVLGDRVSEAIATNVDVAARIEVVNAAVRRHPTPPPTNETSKKDDQAIIQALNEVKDRLSVEFPALAGKIQDIKDAQKKEKEMEKKNKIVTMNNIGRSSSLPSNSDSDSGDSSSLRAAADQKLLLEKLEEIRGLCQASTSTAAATTTVPPSVPALIADPAKWKEENVDLKENLAKILALLQEESNKQKLLSQQQGDSVRYLNELNSWLEAFVNNGTSQIQGISNNIERLCNEIGCTSSASNGHLSSKNQGSQPNLVNDIRQLVAGMKARDQNFTALQAAVHSLLEVLTASQAQQGADSQAIAGLMDRQRHDQEAMFRAFTNEISGEIKGERLRFVDAMKEATAINVQLHVEQFKQELSREVMAMTEEVGRLHREKQIVENQISDLFSFYSKHKKAEMPLQVIPPNTGVPIRNNVQEAPRANIPRSNRQRALPAYPRQQ